MSNERVYRVYDGVEYEVLPLSNFVSSPLVTTAAALLSSQVTIEEEEHEDRVIHAKRARSFLTNPTANFGGRRKGYRKRCQ
jgi:hypothetical protein